MLKRAKWRRLWSHQLKRRSLILLGVVGVVSLMVALLGPISFWATPVAHLRGKENADAVNATRQILLAAVGGLAVLSGAAFTTRTFYLSKRGQLTDRYVKAIGLLASERTTERIGGVYALEHLMLESDRDHSTIVEVLAAFIRERTGSPEPVETPDGQHHHQEHAQWPRIDAAVQAALTALGRRPDRSERYELVDLSETDLCGANLTNLNFSRASFWKANLRHIRMICTRLEGANLCWAQLQDAGLTAADLRGAMLIGAQLQEAVLMEAQMQNADLEQANLEGAYLANTDLHGVNLIGARLQGADFVAYPIGKPAPAPRGLSRRQLDSADWDESTRLPEDLRNPPPSISQP